MICDFPLDKFQSLPKHSLNNLFHSARHALPVLGRLGRDEAGSAAVQPHPGWGMKRASALKGAQKER